MFPISMFLILVISYAIIVPAFHHVATADHGNTPPVRTHSLDHSPSEFTVGEAIHAHHRTPVLGPNAACVPRVAGDEDNLLSLLGQFVIPFVSARISYVSATYQLCISVDALSRS